VSLIGPVHGRWGQPSSTNVHIAASPSSIIPQYDDHSEFGPDFSQLSLSSRCPPEVSSTHHNRPCQTV